MLGGFKILKLPNIQTNQTKTTVILDDIKMSTTTDGIHAPLDQQTYE